MGKDSSSDNIFQNIFEKVKILTHLGQDQKMLVFAFT